MGDNFAPDCGTFIIEGAVRVMVTITAVGDGTLKIDVKVLDETGEIGDLRSLFFDVADESLISGLKITGSSVTGTQFAEDGVSNLGSGNNVNGSIVNENGKFDVGVAFGTAGIGKDDIREASFILSHNTADLTYDFLAVQDFAVRLTSVGEEGGEREDSLKLAGSSPEPCEPNAPPEPMDDKAKLCSDASVAIAVLLNDDPEDDPLEVVEINGISIAPNGTVTLASGAVVTLNGDGTLTYDLSGVDDFDSLLIGEQATDQFAYTVSDGNGGTSSATVTVGICGALNTLETVHASLPSTITFELKELAADPIFGPIDYAMIVSGTDPRLDGVIEAVYCVDPTTEVVPDILIQGNLYLADATSVPSGLVGKPENLDNLAWLMNQQFETQDNGDGTGETYTTGEIQAAIWRLMTGQEFFVPGGGNPPQNAARANAAEIYNAALASGDGFVPGDGDIVSLIVDPTNEATANTGFEQPFVIGVPFDELEQECECNCASDYLV